MIDLKIIKISKTKGGYKNIENTRILVPHAVEN